MQKDIYFYNFSNPQPLQSEGPSRLLSDYLSKAAYYGRSPCTVSYKFRLAYFTFVSSAVSELRFTLLLRWFLWTYQSRLSCIVLTIDVLRTGCGLCSYIAVQRKASSYKWASSTTLLGSFTWIPHLHLLMTEQWIDMAQTLITCFTLVLQTCQYIIVITFYNIDKHKNLWLLYLMITQDFHYKLVF